MLKVIQKSLVNATTLTQRYIKELAKKLLEGFDKQWILNDDDSFDDMDVQQADQKRQVGVHPVLLVATYLDPRFKELKVIESENNRTKVKNCVRDLMETLEKRAGMSWLQRLRT